MTVKMKAINGHLFNDTAPAGIVLPEKSYRSESGFYWSTAHTNTVQWNVVNIPFSNTYN